MASALRVELGPLVYFWCSLLLLEERLYAALSWKRLCESRFVSREFVLYHAVNVLLWAVCIPTIGETLREACMTTHACSARLRPPSPTFGGLFEDTNDHQWRAFRSNLVLLVASNAGATVVATLAQWVISAVWGRAVGLRARRSLRRCAGLATVVVVHGRGASFVFGLTLAAHFSESLAATWVFALLGLLVKESRVRRHVRSLDLLSFLGDGLYGWELSLPHVVLRVISYAHDRSVGARPRHEYTWIDCLAHATYAPVFATGPTVQFDRFSEQQYATADLPLSKRRQRWAFVVSYILRTGMALVFLECFTGRYPIFALGASGAYSKLGGVEFAVFVFLTLNLMWLKFTIIWRCARSLSLFDGVQVPENMRRFVCDTFSISGFWRGWHSSFNEWLIRHVYVPLGGRGAGFLAFCGVFGFATIWHDVEPRLLIWGAMNAVFLATERLVRLDQRAKATARPGVVSAVERGGVAALGAVYILCLVGTNLLGYAAGAANALEMLAAGGLKAGAGFGVGFIVLFSGTQAALEVRRLERIADDEGTEAKALPPRSAGDGASER